MPAIERAKNDTLSPLRDLDILVFTLKVAALSTALIAPVALFLVAVTWRASGRVRALVDALATMPLVLPPTAVGFILLEVLSRRRFFGALLERMDVEVLFTPAAVVIACAVMSFPLVFAAFRSAVDDSNPRLFDIARTLGASPVAAFLRVTLPLSWRGLLAGIALAYCRAVGEFGATILIAGNIPGKTQTMALAIYERVQSGRESDAHPLLAYVIAIALITVVLVEMLRARMRRRVA